MLNKLLAAAAMAAIAYATCPANAAKVQAGCSGGNLTKVESMIEAMADGEGKFAAQKEIAPAQDAMLSGKMGACASHLEQGDARRHGEVSFVEGAGCSRDRPLTKPDQGARASWLAK